MPLLIVFAQFLFSGWILQMCRSLYIDKRWKTDEKRIGDMIEHLATQYHSSTSQNSPNKTVQNRSNSNFQIVLFPEGTNIDDESMFKSHQYADKSNLKRMQNVLHPRTTGFSFITTKMRECK